MNNSIIFSVLGVFIVGTASAGVYIAFRCIERAVIKRHTGSSFRELYEDNRNEGWDPGE